MKASHIIPGFGLVLLLAAYGASLWRSSGMSIGPGDDRSVVRMAHRHLEGGVREAFAELAAAYERENPRVKIELIAIPVRMWTQWVRTQLIGGTAPDLMEIGLGVEDDLLARFFTPIGHLVEQSNPYNDGTPMEGVRWRNTFIDGLNQQPSFNFALMEHFGVPLAMFTHRMFYNRELLRRIAGREEPPQDYEEFIALCRRIGEWGRQQKLAIAPIASSRDTVVYLLSPPWQQQTAPLRPQWDGTRKLVPYSWEVGLDYLTGGWSLRTPEVQSALRLQRELLGFALPGFSQITREDAGFAFLQQRAVFILSGSWDVGTYQMQADFEVGVARLPLPGRGHPRFGPNLPAERLSEGTIRTEAAFGLTRGAPQAEAATDFLRFIGSRRGAAIFSATSGWLPAVADIDLPEAVRPFAPEMEGLPPGLTLVSIGGADASLAVFRHLHVLAAEQGSVDAFADALEMDYGAALRSAMNRQWRISQQHLRRQDGLLFAWHQLSLVAESDPGPAERLALAIGTQTESESNRAWYAYAAARGQTSP